MSDDPMWAVCLKSVGEPIIDRSILGTTLLDLLLEPTDDAVPPGMQQVKHWVSQDDSELTPIKVRAVQLVILVLALGFKV